MTRPVRRLAGVVLLVVGMLAMHGLVSPDHGSHGRAGAPVVSSAAGLPGGHGSATSVRTSPGPSAAELSTGSLTSLPEVAAVALGLCLAVLLGVVLLRRTGGGWSTAPPQPAVTPTVRTSPPGRGPPRLLLAQLCVLRT